MRYSVIMISIRKIAQQLNLSPSTVSKAIRGQVGEVSLDTAKRILAHCHQSGYLSKTETSQIIAKMTVQESKQQIFIVSCRKGIEFFYNETLTGICETIQNNRLYPSLYIGTNQDFLDQFPFERASSIIILGRTDPDFVHLFTSHKIPTILVDNRISNSTSFAVNSDNLEGVFSSVETLIKLGHRRIAFFCMHESQAEPTYTFLQRQSGYIAGITQFGLAYDPSLVVIGYGEGNILSQYRVNECIQTLRRLAKRVLEIDPLPTAVISANDLAAYALRGVLSEHGIRVPEDISIVGYDGMHLLENRPPGFAPISTRVVKWREMGQSAAEMAIEIAASSELRSKYITIPTVYEDAGTVAKPRKD